jgi:FkbM family methyltransferase
MDLSGKEGPMTRTAAIRGALKSSLSRMGIDVRYLQHRPFGQAWIDDVKYFKDGDELRTIFDVGANQGQTALKMIRAWPMARVFSFEPVPATFLMLQANTAQLRNVTAICAALGKSVGQESMTAEPGSGTNTMLPVPSPPRQDTVTVSLDTVSHFCEESKVDSIDLLKVDTEGSDLDVLRGANELLSDPTAGGRRIKQARN